MSPFAPEKEDWNIIFKVAETVSMKRLCIELHICSQFDSSLISLQWHFKRNLLQLRKQKFNVTVKQLVEYNGLNLRSASRRTYSRCLNNMGFRFLQARKKGLLNDKHIKSRVRYARKMLLHERTNPGFWTNEVGFYLDGVSFVYNHNIWRSILFKILWVLYHVLQ